MDRAQAHTLEAIVAGLLLLSSVAYALQMTAVTPLSASTSSQHIENQQRAMAEGVLTAAAERDVLSETVRYWNNSTAQFQSAGDLGYYTSQPPDTVFGGMLEQAFDAQGVAYNVYLQYQTADGDLVRKRLIYRGQPSDHAVRAGRSVTLTDEQRLVNPDGSRNETLTAADSYFVDDVGGSVYNVVRVEVVAWRI